MKKTVTTKCSDENIAEQLIEYARSKNERMIYLFCIDQLVSWTKCVEYTIDVIKKLRKSGIYLCIMDAGIRTDRLEQDEELRNEIYLSWLRVKRELCMDY